MPASKGRGTDSSKKIPNFIRGTIHDEGMLRAMSWLPERAAGGDDFERTFALRPDLFAAWREFAGLFWEKRLVDPVVLELCRLRIAQMHGARHALALRTPEARAAGLDETK